MRSFTSSFDRSILFPVRVVLATIALVLAYDLLVTIARPDAVINYDSGLRNKVIADRYADGETPRAVLVGSSHGYRLATDFMGGAYLEPYVFNLSLAGGSPLTGLGVIERKGPLPRLIFVEMNVLERGYDGDFVASIFAEPWKALRRAIPAFRLENRPFDVVIGSAWQATRRLLERGGIVPTERVYSAPEVNPRGTAASSPPDDGAQKVLAKLAEAIDDLGRQVDALRARNVRVVLVDFPIDPSIDNSQAERRKQAMRLERFPPERYEWLDLRSIGTYQTEDGLHLTKASARDVALVLARVAADDRGR